ncbi:S-adenosyl-L-methionine-dependent methyltransferase [Mycena belliarum]|uniref:S-adenosyl-L-methionine-dependent methyltransferase n=1 Tax=Mycena belliarum TaxID=1033014 RepID=A0AAD6U2K4_9AGAR|nr:S-adenosyl-L-methionine-dependent methyltransferase [Mycena belliae]
MNFYFEAAKTLDRLDAKQGSIKGILATLPEKDRKRTAALVIETLKYKSVLADIIKEAKLMAEERKKLTSSNLALVLVHDVLLAGGIQAGDGPIKQAILRHKTRLHGEFQKLKIKRGFRSNAELAQSGDARAEQIPRYARVNTIMWTLDDAVKYFISQGLVLGAPLESIKAFAKDEHILNLLLFPPQTTFHDDPAYKSGKLILQDKASCFPAVVLAPPARKDAVVIDATAAPGNKTTHMSALMRNMGKLYAFERDRKRFGTLTMMLSKAGCKNVEPVNLDFLTVDPLDPKFAQATHILLDPSCSGSGIVNRLDHLLETEEENQEAQEDRLNKLAAFQLTMIKHAMKFPKVSRIVYSTCSVHATENERVVRAALLSDEALGGPFHLASRDTVLPAWQRRGMPVEMTDPDDATSLIRCMPGEDATNGFFVSCFIRQHPNPVAALSKRKAESQDENEVHDGGEDMERPKRKKKKKAKHKSVVPS